MPDGSVSGRSVLGGSLPGGSVPNVGESLYWLAGKKVLLVDMNYAPELTGIAPYAGGVARALAQYTDQVQVLTGRPYVPETVPPLFRRRMLRAVPVDDDPPNLRVRRLAHLVPSRQAAPGTVVSETSFLAHALISRPGLVPDLVIGVTPSLVGALAAAGLAGRYGVPLVIVVQDLMVNGARGLEGWALRRASAQSSE